MIKSVSNQYYLTFCISLLLLLISGCANEMAPTGGAQDTEPPKFVSAKPENESLRFNGKRIKIKFNEFIDYSINPGEIQVTPEMEKPPLFYVENKTLNIILKDTLKSNTTYNFQFGNSIKDLNEKNVLPGFTYCFSTGDSLDKGTLSGSVKYITDLNTPADCIIGLYSDSLFDKKPVYFTKSNSDGKFIFKNIKKADYYTVAFEDINGNRIYDRFDGYVGFIESKISVSDSSASTDLFLFPDNIKSIEKIFALNDKNFLAVSKPVEKIELNISPKNDIEYTLFNETHDTLFLWYKNPADTLTYESKIQDSVYSVKSKANNIKDTLYISDLSIEPISPVSDVRVEANHPLGNCKNEKIIVLEDSVKTIKDVKCIIKNSENTATLSFSMKENKKYFIIAEDSALVDIFNNYNKKKILKISTGSENEFGNLILKLSGTTENMIVELFDEKKNRVSKNYMTPQTKLLEFRNLKKGKYYILGTFDTNKNGYWDSGDFRKGMAPEMKKLLKENVEIKGGWDVDLEIKL